MKEFKTNFNDGTGELNIQYEGTAGTTEAPVTSDCNCGEDRTVQVNVVTDDGKVSKNVTVNQEGVREQFIPSDQTEGMRGSDGELFLGIKEKFADAVPECCIPFNGNIIYINQLESDPAKMISGDVNGSIIQWIRNNSHRVLAKKTGEGTMTYAVLDDNNSTLYSDGTTADLNGSEGDVFVKLPTFYYAGNDDGTGASGDNVEITFSKKPFENSIEWDTNILIGAYEAYYGNSKLQSISGVASSANISQANFKRYARNRGTGYQIVDWQMHCVLGCLFYAMYGNTDSQAVCGVGTGSYTKATGQTNTLGMNDTIASVNGNDQSINFWGLENWWGNKIEWMEGMNSTAALYVETEDPDPFPGRNFYWPRSTSFGRHFRFGRYLDLACDTSDNGNVSTYYCDMNYGPNNASLILARSCYVSYMHGGVAYAFASYGASSTSSYCGSRLAFRGECVESESVAAFKALPVL